MILASTSRTVHTTFSNICPDFFKLHLLFFFAFMTAFLPLLHAFFRLFTPPSHPIIQSRPGAAEVDVGGGRVGSPTDLAHREVGGRGEGGGTTSTTPGSGVEERKDMMRLRDLPLIYCCHDHNSISTKMTTNVHTKRKNYIAYMVSQNEGARRESVKVYFGNEICMWQGKCIA